jgi:S-adenosylmethionine:tRNA ribosyltransferase-isomerase
MKTSDFDYDLPEELIAQTPIEPRDQSRLLVIDRKTGGLTHRHFYEIINYLVPGDLLVMNDSRVIPARLYGTKRGTGASCEVLLLKRYELNLWEALVRPAKRLKEGTVIDLEGGKGVTCEIVESFEEGRKKVRLSDEKQIYTLGHMPLPPYIHTPLANGERYQTVYSHDYGSVAAPTAGLHYTPELLDKIRNMGIDTVFTTLHVGLDTFRPFTEEDPTQHHIHMEYGQISEEAADKISSAKEEGRRVICVGTTSVRLVEHAAHHSVNRVVDPFSGWVDTFILPGFEFKAVDVMQTNFHLPKSSLIMLVSAFAGQDLIKKAYSEAIRERYRFYSFGDACLII